MSRARKTARNDPLQVLPGNGPACADALRSLGYLHPDDLAGEDPEAMYNRYCGHRPGEYVDRCVLYVFRCAVYVASNDAPEAEKLKWWHWKD